MYTYIRLPVAPNTHAHTHTTLSRRPTAPLSTQHRRSGACRGWGARKRAHWRHMEASRPPPTVPSQSQHYPSLYRMKSAHTTHMHMHIPRRPHHHRSHSHPQHHPSGRAHMRGGGLPRPGSTRRRPFPQASRWPSPCLSQSHGGERSSHPTGGIDNGHGQQGHKEGQQIRIVHTSRSPSPSTLSRS